MGLTREDDSCDANRCRAQKEPTQRRLLLHEASQYKVGTPYRKPQAFGHAAEGPSLKPLLVGRGFEDVCVDEAGKGNAAIIGDREEEDGDPESEDQEGDECGGGSGEERLVEDEVGEEGRDEEADEQPAKG